MYDCNDDATWEWGIPCTTEMMHMPQCNYHDVEQMMHTPWCKDDDTCNVCTYEMHGVWCIPSWVDDAYDSHPTTVLLELTPG
jgi:hypothetical protein